MKLKKFNQYIKEDYSSEYDIENPPIGDGDNLTTQEDESQENNQYSDEEEGECETPLYSEEGEAIDMKGEISKMDISILQKIASGEIDVATIAQDILNSMANDEDGESDEDNDDNIDSEEHGKEVEPSHEEGREFFPQLSLEESLKFKNFKKRK